MKGITKIVFIDIVKNKIIIGYALLLALLSWGSFAMEDNASKGLLTILNIVLFTVPLVCILFPTIYLYNRTEFIELLLSQPMKRPKIWLSFYKAMCFVLLLSFLIGVGIPLFIYSPNLSSISLLVVGSFLSLIFVALAFLSSVLTRDKTRGIGTSILIWFFFSVIFDSLLLFFIFQFSEYPIEKSLLTIAVFNPIDMGRINILLQLDASAMMGYIGALFRKSFGSTKGMILSFVILSLWTFVPLFISLRLFKRKDL